ncbi:MAG TPA: type II toxin-antitoxin system VapC family toxin [Saprospiraceae bacterium]|nr:type II toxin-antitoxin system VapC family toxin [Saprospiraceae bacterium]
MWTIIDDSTNTLYVSAVSYWEITLKSNLGKIQLPKTKPAELFLHATKSGILSLDLLSEYASFDRLPFFENHKDPFDRMIIHQCITKGYILISSNRVFEKYIDSGLVLLHN